MPKRTPSDLVSDAKDNTTELAVEKQKRATAAWRAKYRDIVAQSVTLEKRLETVLAISEPPRMVTRKRKILKGKKGKGRGVAVICPATDWHVEERVFPAGVNGVNDFNIAEAERRIKQYYSKILHLIDHQNDLAPVVEIWHPLLGDLISGYIHDELLETNELSPTEACHFLQQMIGAGIELWLKETDLPIYIPTCVGNHGRTTFKKRIKTSFKNSFEWLLYKMMAEQYKDNPRVTWMVGEGYHNIQEIQGRMVRFHHGDGLRYNGGVGGITIPVNKSISQWNKVTPVDLDVFGHWHTALWNYPTWISCGCLMGYSEYSVEIKADFQHPTQMFIVMDRDYGVTSAIPVFLTEPRRNQK
jgi:hypothetical protein